MRAAGLQGRVVKVTRRAPGVHRFFEATDNLRVATAPPTAINQQWVGDVTYLKANNHHRLHSSIDYHTPQEYERLVP
jgi:transposase InsO family protein